MLLREFTVINANEVRGTGVLFKLVTLVVKSFTALSNVQEHVLNFDINKTERRQQTEHLVSYARDPKKAQCDSVETTILKRRLLMTAHRTTNDERLTWRVAFRTIVGGENQGSGRPEIKRATCLADNPRG